MGVEKVVRIDGLAATATYRFNWIMAILTGIVLGVVAWFFLQAEFIATVTGNRGKVIGSSPWWGEGSWWIIGLVIVFVLFMAYAVGRCFPLRDEVAAPAPPPAPSKARGARTKNERSWAARIQENYPARALREEIEGTVGVRVTVTADGRASGCSVTSSSGSDILDSAACQGMERYARFDPALDAAGNPTTDSYSTRITYKLN